MHATAPMFVLLWCNFFGPLFGSERVRFPSGHSAGACSTYHIVGVDLKHLILSCRPILCCVVLCCGTAGLGSSGAPSGCGCSGVAMRLVPSPALVPCTAEPWKPSSEFWPHTLCSCMPGGTKRSLRRSSLSGTNRTAPPRTAPLAAPPHSTLLCCVALLLASSCKASSGLTCGGWLAYGLVQHQVCHCKRRRFLRQLRAGYFLS